MIDYLLKIRNGQLPPPDIITVGQLLQRRMMTVDLAVPIETARRRFAEAFAEKVHLGNFWRSEKKFKCSIDGDRIKVKYNFIGKGRDEDCFQRTLWGSLYAAPDGRSKIELTVSSSFSWSAFVIHLILSAVIVFGFGAGIGLDGFWIAAFTAIFTPPFMLLFQAAYFFNRLGERINALTNTAAVLQNIADGRPPES